MQLCFLIVSIVFSIRQQINLCQQNNVETEQQCAERQIELKQMQKWKKQQQSQTNYGHKE